MITPFFIIIIFLFNTQIHKLRSDIKHSMFSAFITVVNGRNDFNLLVQQNLLHGLQRKDWNVIRFATTVLK